MTPRASGHAFHEAPLEEFLVEIGLVLPLLAAMTALALVVQPIVIVAPPLPSLCPSPAGRYHPSPHSFVPIVS
jgi:hypothetical protein